MRIHDGTAQSGRIAFVGATVEPVASERLEGGTVIVRDGVIEAVGRVEPPSDARIVDVSGRWLLPGFVDAHAHVGVHEESVGEPGADVNESSLANTAGVRALDAINPRDVGFADALTGGVTCVVVKPGSGNPIGGQAVALKTAGGPTVDDLVVREPVSIKSAFGENPKTVHGGQGRTPVTRMGTAFVIRQALIDARNYREQRENGSVAPDLHSDALVRLLEGDLLWDVHAHRQDDIATAMRLAREFDLRWVLNHATEGYLVVDRIAELDVPVVVGPLSVARSKVETSGHRIDGPAMLHEAGVRIALMTDHPEVPLELLVLQAVLAVREGLPRDVGLQGITTRPAEFYGLDSRVGAIAPGLDADLVVWSGDPLDLRSRVEQTYITGRLLYEREPGKA
jgi:imidazolonepropionase-like amidohydrolase